MSINWANSIIEGVEKKKEKERGKIRLKLRDWEFTRE